MFERNPAAFCDFRLCQSVSLFAIVIAKYERKSCEVFTIISSDSTAQSSCTKSLLELENCWLQLHDQFFPLLSMFLKCLNEISSFFNLDTRVKSTFDRTSTLPESSRSARRTRCRCCVVDLRRQRSHQSGSVKSNNLRVCAAFQVSDFNKLKHKVLQKRSKSLDSL